VCLLDTSVGGGGGEQGGVDSCERGGCTLWGWGRGGGGGGIIHVNLEFI
jgi:hypothetical protein